MMKNGVLNDAAVPMPSALEEPPPPANVVTCHALGLGGGGSGIGFSGSGAGGSGVGFPPSGMALPPPSDVVVPPLPPGEGQEMSSSDTVNTASSAPAGLNR